MSAIRSATARLTSSGPKISWTTTTPGSFCRRRPHRIPLQVRRSTGRRTEARRGLPWSRSARPSWHDPTTADRSGHTPDGSAEGQPDERVAGHRRDLGMPASLAKTLSRWSGPGRGCGRSPCSRPSRTRRRRSPGSAICDVFTIWPDPTVASATLEIDLEVDVRPAARVAGREDRREGHRAVGVGLLHAAQVVLSVTPPSRASTCRRGRSATGRRRPRWRAPRRGSRTRELDRHRDARRGRRRGAEAGPDVACARCRSRRGRPPRWTRRRDTARRSRPATSVRVPEALEDVVDEPLEAAPRWPLDVVDEDEPAGRGPRVPVLQAASAARAPAPPRSPSARRRFIVPRS